jgi:hypothetical protein
MTIQNTITLLGVFDMLTLLSFMYTVLPLTNH